MRTPSHSVTTIGTPPSMVLTMKNWCWEHIGAPWDPVPSHNLAHGTWIVTWGGPTVHYGISHEWKFFSEQDAAFFALRWT